MSQQFRCPQCGHVASFSNDLGVTLRPGDQITCNNCGTEFGITHSTTLPVMEAKEKAQFFKDLQILVDSALGRITVGNHLHEAAYRMRKRFSGPSPSPLESYLTSPKREEP